MPGGSGPIAITTWVYGVNSGDWNVTAGVVEATTEARDGIGRLVRTRIPAPQLHPAAWSWRRWRLTAAAPAPIRTRPQPLARPPAVLLGSWIGLTLLGVLVALFLQGLLFDAVGIAVGRPVTVSLLLLPAGVIGAKAWFLVVNRRTRRKDSWWPRRLLAGWCVQGFIAGAAVAARHCCSRPGHPWGVSST